MEFTITDQGQEKHVTLSGQFTFADNQKFRQIMELLGSSQLTAIRMNFNGVDFIDSAGLGMLLLLRDECQQRHIPISIHAAQGQVEKIFLISKFDQLFSMVPSR